jgi:hypothetical protein
LGSKPFSDAEAKIIETRPSRDFQSDLAEELGFFNKPAGKAAQRYYLALLQIAGRRSRRDTRQIKELVYRSNESRISIDISDMIIPKKTTELENA